MFTKLIRIGRDAEMKYTPQGTALLEMSCVYDVGFGDKKQSQWVKIAMFGQRAEKLVSHFTKGKQIVATMDDVKAEAWNDKATNEAKSGLSAKLVEFEFVSDGQQQAQPQQQYQQPVPQQSWGNVPQQPPSHQPAPQMAPPHQQVPTPKPQGYGRK